jgi:alanyl-tRNA synthetase
VHRSGQLGLVKLLSESSIGAGVRRVEALVGADAYQFLAREHVLLNSLTQIIKGARVDELPSRVNDLVTKMKDIEKELASLRTSAALQGAGKLIESAKDLSGTSFISGSLADGIAADSLREIALDLRARSSKSVVALTSVVEGKVVLVVAVSEAARSSQVKAGALVKVASAILGGGGGGKDDFAQGGGMDSAKIPEAMKAIELAIAGN